MKLATSILAAPLLLASPAFADATDPGAQTFARSCAMCHANAANAPRKLGPNLYGVVGRKAASVPGFNYSPAMAKSSLTWDAATLDRYLAKPSAVVPGNRMGFAGVPSPADRAALVKYLKSSVQ